MSEKQHDSRDFDRKVAKILDVVVGPKAARIVELQAEVASLRARLASAEHALTTIATRGEADTETGGQSGPGGDRPVDVARAALAAMEVGGDGADGDVDLRGRLAAAQAERDAILRWSIRHAGYIGQSTRVEPDMQWWAGSDNGKVYGRTAEEVVRKAAGLAPAADAKGEPDAQA